MLKTRADLLKQEKLTLAPYAMHSAETKGRLYKEPDDPVRLPFQRDRDRIIHARAFRRMEAKTQVFVSRTGDHYRNRMTHSIEVSQIARGISRTLGLNEDLAECIALAHDLGHPPFGHGGETALNEAMQKHGDHFEHNEQSLRIVTELENVYPGFNGLNLSIEVIDGLLKHNPRPEDKHLQFKISPHLEMQVTDFADEIAYTNHDIDDALRAGIITLEQVRQVDIWREAEKEVNKLYKEVDTDRLTGRIISRMISGMIKDLQETTALSIDKNGIDSIEKVRAFPEKIVTFSPEKRAKINELRKFLRDNFYLHPKVSGQIDKGRRIIGELFEYYLANKEKLPLHYKTEGGEGAVIAVKDYIAGMTDHYAEEKWKAIRN